MPRLKEYFKQNKRQILLGGLVILALVVIVLHGLSEVKKYGVITVAKVIKYEGDPEGSSLYLVLYFKGEKINAIANAMCRKCEGKFYFVRVLRHKPTKGVAFYEDKPVPDCILEKALPKEGWEEIPTCE